MWGGRRLFALHINHLDASSFQQVDAVGQSVFLTIDHTLDTGLDDEFGTFYARRGRDIERRAVAIVGAAGEFGDGIGFGVKYIGLGNVVLVLTYILKSARSTVIAVADDHFVFHHEGAHLPSLAVAVFCPYLRHAQVALVKLSLFVV